MYNFYILSVYNLPHRIAAIENIAMVEEAGFAASSELCSEAEKLLLLGESSTAVESENNGTSPIKLIREASAVMLHKFEGVSEDIGAYKDTLLRKKEQIKSIKEHTLAAPVLEEYKRYVLAKRELDILECVRALLRLRAWKSTREIPALVLAISVPDGITREMKVSQLLVGVVGEVKLALLQRYHEGFGCSLSDDAVSGLAPGAEVETGGVAADGEEGQHLERHRQQWAEFIEETREWLVSYTLVALLPHTREDLRVVLERFQDALDTTLTPLWGRFSFHLVHARESHSIAQLMWTFAYARDFASMLDTLCATLTQGKAGTSEAPLVRLIRGVRSGAGGGNQSGGGAPGGYAQAAKQYIADKVCKFMRAHVASVLSEWHPLADGTLFQVVESSLELDHFLYADILLGTQSAPRLGVGQAHSKEQVPVLGQSVAGLLYDVRELFLRWVSADLDHFQRLLAAELGSERGAFEQRSFSLQVEPDADVPRSRFVAPGARLVHHSSCVGVHLCCHLFVLACARYRHLPRQAQIVASKCVLEPLLCCANTVLLYRAHSHPLLQLVLRARQAMEARDGGTTGGLLAAMGVRPQDIAQFRRAALEVSCSAAFLQFFLRQAVGAVAGGNDIASIVVSADGSTTGQSPSSASVASSGFLNIESYWRNCQTAIRAAARTTSLVVMDVPAAAAESMGGSGGGSLSTTNNNFNATVFSALLAKVLRRNASVADVAHACAPMLRNCNNGSLCIPSSVEYTCDQAQIMAAAMSV